MKRIVKRVGVGLLVVVALLVVSVGGYATVQSRAYDASMAKVYDIAPLPVTRSTDPAVLARGKHLAESIAACAGNDCHGPDLGGGKLMEMGPLGKFQAPNISPGGLGAAYSDGELARLIRHGVKKDGRSVTFMPVQDINWMPESDLVAVISYVRSVPAVNKPNGPLELGTLAKVLDVRGMLVLDVARRIDHTKMELGPAPSPTPEYGKYLGRLCTGCHGDHFSGGPIPGAPSDFPKPLNITPHATGLADWTFEDFDKLLSEGVRKNGKKLDPFMPLEAIGKMDETERKALWAYLRTVPPMPYGGR
jgi:hypothetical protein